MDTGIQKVELALINAHPANFFHVEEDVTELAESIAVNGLLQPLVVTPDFNGRYRTVSGHRRRAALLKLSKEYPEKWKFVDCLVIHPENYELEMLALIQTNTAARVIGWQERAEASVRTEKILVKLQEQGIVLPGKMRSHVAELLKSSESQIARAKFISKNLIEPFKDLSSAVSEDVAYRLAHFSAEQQEELYEHYKQSPKLLTSAAIKRYKDNLSAGREPFFVQASAPKKSEPSKRYVKASSAAAPSALSGNDERSAQKWCRSLYQDYAPREGELFLVVLSDKILPSIVHCKPCRWRHGRFVLAANESIHPIESMVCFLPLPELPIGFTFNLCE